MRSKKGERERQAERKGECTGSWWAAPSLPFVRVGVGVASSSPFVGVGIGVASPPSSVFVLCGPRSLSSIAHCCPPFVHVRRALLRGLASLALHLALVEVEGAGRQRSCVVDAGGVALVGSVHPVVARGGRVWVSWALVVIGACCVRRASLLPLLCGRCILLDRCCRSWTAGVVLPCGLHVALHGVDVVAKRTWVVAGGVSRLWEAWLAWWLLVEEDTSQGCDFGVTFNMHVKSTNVWDVVWPYFKQVLLATRHPNRTVNPSHVFDAENEHIYA